MGVWNPEARGGLRITVLIGGVVPMHPCTAPAISRQSGLGMSECLPTPGSGVLHLILVEEGGMSENPKRCRLTVVEELRILEEAQQPGVQIADLCRRHGISTSQFYGWREQAR